ncbi:DUF4177 domain-containing protein [Clostridium sp. D2Q-11]|uniref:DUF4177 domain-containing protein n=1 Tax=Anaeromonas frigoriresistens TaxID=2683708 RepID=A0A942Z621_9FIRM|nr:DUF4177 domain-containing protein [Anaeromonas frigoriresistens]MBS4537112.1 DUF4177 domain-containing protein [Anaeromonas frigoriresistens]
MKKFEYKVENLRLHGMTSMVLTKDHEKKMNELGEQGWEMVGISTSASGRNVISVFKREKEE